MFQLSWLPEWHCPLCSVPLCAVHVTVKKQLWTCIEVKDGFVIAISKSNEKRETTSCSILLVSIRVERRSTKCTLYIDWIYWAAQSHTDMFWDVLICSSFSKPSSQRPGCVSVGMRMRSDDTLEGLSQSHRMAMNFKCRIRAYREAGTWERLSQLSANLILIFSSFFSFSGNIVSREDASLLLSSFGYDHDEHPLFSICRKQQLRVRVSWGSASLTEKWHTDLIEYSISRRNMIRIAFLFECVLSEGDAENREWILAHCYNFYTWIDDWNTKFSATSSACRWVVGHGDSFDGARPSKAVPVYNAFHSLLFGNARMFCSARKVTPSLGLIIDLYFCFRWRHGRLIPVRTCGTKPTPWCVPLGLHLFRYRRFDLNSIIWVEIWWKHAFWRRCNGCLVMNSSVEADKTVPHSTSQLSWMNRVLFIWSFLGFKMIVNHILSQYYPTFSQLSI